MKKGNLILISGKDLVVVKMSAMSLVSTEMNVVIGSNDRAELEYDIEHLKPDIVLIWGVDNSDSILEFVIKWENHDVNPFFIVTTCYRNVYDILDNNLPRNAYAVLEPESMKFIKDIIKEEIDRKYSLGVK